MKKVRSLRWWREIAAIVVGAALGGAAIALLLEPNRIVPGGVTGLAMILKDLLGVPYGVLYAVLNVPLLWLGWRYLGGHSMLARTVLGVAVTAASIDAFGAWSGPLTEDRLLVIFYGGLLSGVGLALVFHGRGTTGGTDILSRLIHLWFETGVGQAMLGLNVIVFGLAALIYGLEQAAIALMVSFVLTKSLDSLLHGLVATRAALVVTRHAREVTTAVTEHLRRGVTRVEGHGGFSGEPRSVLYVVVTRAEVARLKRRVMEADPEAFMVITSPQEVIGTGLGFRRV